MSVKMILQDGPLDGEQQLVLDLPTAAGSQLTFTLPNYQTFAPDGETITGLGLQVVYALLEQGPPPGSADTWDTSWIYEFAEEFFVPPPPFVPPVTPPQLPLQSSWRATPP